MKLTPQQARIINELKEGSLNTGDFMARCCPHCGKGKGLNIVNFSQRITELKRMGYDIRSKQVKRGLWKYWLEQAYELKTPLNEEKLGEMTAPAHLFPDTEKKVRLW